MKCQLNQITVHYEEIGEGKPILFLHGFAYDLRQMKGACEPIFEGIPGYRRIYLDLPGHGHTKGEAWMDSSDQILQVVLDFIDQVLPGQAYAIGAFSYGSYIARGVVHRRMADVAGLMMICPAVLADERTLPRVDATVPNQELLASLSSEDAELFHSKIRVQTQETWERFRDEVMPGRDIRDIGFLTRLRTGGGYPFTFDVDQLPQPFAKPTAIITGRQDDIAGYHDAYQLIHHTYPHATYAVLDGASHHAYLERDVIFRAITADWLTRIVW
ncbi:alpha/beta fold hydrolase [Brevibacillus dissolubilis]|uniref:alpha/beta fold hydrolase n=1 Tax=Brevibacillus dissolubilis TaxID=1844116 RepID=UPI00159BD2BF|nr:alpha/beta hydrolase [Brevibacillus dissolubilis]